MRKPEEPGVVEGNCADAGYSLMQPKATLVVVGGAGCNAAERFCLHSLIEKEGLGDIEVVAINTDEPRLNALIGADKKVLLGLGITKGRGAGHAEVGQFVAEESRGAIHEVISGSDIVLIMGNAGGGTGAGVMPVVAELARDSGALVVCIVSKPFSFESEQRHENARVCLSKLRKVANTVLEISNDSMVEKFSDMTMDEVFLVLDRVALKVIKNIVDSINKTVTASFLPELQEILRADDGLGVQEDNPEAEPAVEPSLQIPVLIDANGSEMATTASVKVEHPTAEELKTIVTSQHPSSVIVSHEPATGGQEPASAHQATVSVHHAPAQSAQTTLDGHGTANAMSQSQQTQAPVPTKPENPGEVPINPAQQPPSLNPPARQSTA